ncbi:Nmad3 family putative nucleotide modification protein [Halarchaeum nitratireducens]|uniref:Nucleotide modification associated domain-containing protein n=1 Tax=Halarchaeum nitratireducens TaxID=489913 RepID=A0A830GEI0_9EURY|nr:hypothetical protein [Halarchaeum nitratireducens]GGN25795.1 hypothetical protein GCM10009021_29860 [Halarchaeum nitratireducens]
MTVVLVGVGADTEHLCPALELTEGGKFDYIPIPESYPTNEESTHGNWELQHRGGYASEFVDGISPRGEDSDWIRDAEKIKSHPVHHDPNFEAMTFGDRRGQGGKGTTLVKHLDSTGEDVLGFYTGMKDGPDDSNLNRFLYGYMTVEAVHDLSQLEGDEYHDAIEQFPENAHAKRLAAAGTPKHDDLVIIEGRKPTAKIDSPIKISERLDRAPWYQVSQSFANEFNVESGQKGIGRKFPLILDMDGDSFIEKIERT